MPPWFLEVSDCNDILRHHNSRIMTYHDCHILQTFGTNKQAVVYSNTCQRTIPMHMVADVMESHSMYSLQVLLVHNRTKVQILMTLHMWKGRHQHHDYEDYTMIVQKSPSPTYTDSITYMFAQK